MIPKLNQSVLRNLEFTKLLQESHENEAPKITFVQNINKEYNFKIHFLELIFESNLWHKTFSKGVKEVLEEATPLLKMCLTNDNSTNTINKISFARLCGLLDITEGDHNSINKSTLFKEHISDFPNTVVSSQVDNNNATKLSSEGLITDNTYNPTEFNSVIKQKFDFTGNFVNFDISQSEKYETPTIDLFSQAQKRVKFEIPNPIEIMGRVNGRKEIESAGTEIYGKRLSASMETVEDFSASATNKLTESEYTRVNETNEYTGVRETNENTGIYEIKLINFIKENSLPMFTKQFKTLKKLHKCIISFIDDSYESKFSLTQQKAEEDVFKQICNDYEL